MAPPREPPTWTWRTAIFVTVMVADLFALTWYLWAFPAEVQHWEKAVGVVAGWVTSAMAFWGIKYGVGKRLSLAKAVSLLPLQLSLVVSTVGIWFFILPFHTIAVDVHGPGAAPLSGVTASVDGAGAPRPDASDAQGRLKVTGLLASKHKIVLEKRGYVGQEFSVRCPRLLRICSPSPGRN